MKAKYCISTTSKTLTLLGLILCASIAWAPGAFASTSGGATIFNQVTVTYSSGTQTGLLSTADVSVGVITLAAAPTVTIDQTAQTTDAGGTVHYVYTIRPNSNGPDTYTVTTPVTSTSTNVSDPTNSLNNASITLWGGIVVSASGGSISLPGGTVSSLANGEIVELPTGQYTITSITPGNAASPGTPETLASLTLTPVGSAPAITSSNVSAGDQVGQIGTITLTQVAGTPSTPGTDGTHVTDLTFTTTATDASGSTVTYSTKSGDSNEATTTVSNPQLAITKEARNLTTGGTFAATGTTAKPGQTIEYRITVTNPSTTGSATGVYISDAVPAYTSLVATEYNSNADAVQIVTTPNGGSASTTYATSAADSDVATLTGSNLRVNLGSGADNANGGTLAPGDQVVINFSVTVQ